MDLIRPRKQEIAGAEGFCQGIGVVNDLIYGFSSSGDKLVMDGRACHTYVY